MKANQYKDSIKFYREYANMSKSEAFKVNYGYLFTDDEISLEVYRYCNVATVFNGNSILCG